LRIVLAKGWRAAKANPYEEPVYFPVKEPRFQQSKWLIDLLEGCIPGDFKMAAGIFSNGKKCVD
jgi:hypothetical protein